MQRFRLAEKIARVRAVFDALDVPRLHGAADFARFDRALATLDGRTSPMRARSRARVRPQPDGAQEIDDSISRKNSRFGLGDRSRTSIGGLWSIVRDGANRLRCRTLSEKSGGTRKTFEMKRSDIELMAPAGSYEALQAAVQAGADAVYFGVGQLNMRSKSAANFTPDDLERIVGIRPARRG